VKYYIYPESKDGIEMPFTPEPLDLRETFEHLALRIAAYEQKGHFTNANMERIPMSELAFGVVPASEARRVRKKNPRICKSERLGSSNPRPRHQRDIQKNHA
jgi:hypothetical protein